MREVSTVGLGAVLHTIFCAKRVVPENMQAGGAQLG